MFLPDEIQILICGIGAFQSFFFGLYILSKEEWRRSVAILLALLFLVLAVRVAKSAMWAFWTETPLWLLNVGFAAHLAIGPLLYLYIRRGSWRTWKWVHFLPAFLIVIAPTSWTLQDFWYVGGYKALLYHQAAYTLGALYFLIRADSTSHSHAHSDQRIWLWVLWAGVAVLQIAYFSNYVLGLSDYIIGPLLYAVIIYALSFYGLRRQGVFSFTQKTRARKHIRLSEADLQAHSQRIVQYVEDDTPYLNHDFSVAQMAATLNLPKHIASYVINQAFGQSFPEFVNGHRIAHAKTMLADTSHNHIKIASIAYDSGFHSLSAFNAAFKKEMRITPSAFRKKAQRERSANA